MHFLDSPFSLILVSFALLAPPVIAFSKAIQLTSTSFEPAVQKGYWFVVHTSAYAAHWKMMKPTWDQLYEDAQTELPQVRIAEVDCTINADVCTKNGVRGYPWLLLFEDGKIIGEFKGARVLSDMKRFLRVHIKSIAPLEVAPDVSLSSEGHSNALGQVVSLSPATFFSTIARGPVFVMFRARSNLCRKLAPTWRKLAAHRHGEVTIAEVNCEDHLALCKAQGVRVWPTLVWYGKSGAAGERAVYRGAQTFEQLVAFLENTNTFSVPVADTAEPLEPSPTSTEHAVSPDTVLPNWVLTHHLPTSDELTQDSFQNVVNGLPEPLLVVVTGPQMLKDTIMQRLNILGNEWRLKTQGLMSVHGRDIVFAYMDGNEWAHWMRHMYGVKEAQPPSHGDFQRNGLDAVKVVISEPRKLIYYDLDRAGNPIQFTAANLFGAIEDAASENLEYKMKIRTSWWD